MKYTELKDVLQARMVEENMFEIPVPRKGNLADISIFAPTFAHVRLKVGGKVVWSAVASNIVKLPKINMLKTDWHSVQICVESSTTEFESIFAEVTYWLLDDVVDKRRIATEGLPNIHGWQYIDNVVECRI